MSAENETTPLLLRGAANGTVLTTGAVVSPKSNVSKLNRGSEWSICVVLTAAVLLLTAFAAIVMMMMVQPSAPIRPSLSLRHETYSPPPRPAHISAHVVQDRNGAFRVLASPASDRALAVADLTRNGNIYTIVVKMMKFFTTYAVVNNSGWSYLTAEIIVGKQQDSDG
jgi:hypothetical protein